MKPETISRAKAQKAQRRPETRFDGIPLMGSTLGISAGFVRNRFSRLSCIRFLLMFLLFLCTPVLAAENQPRLNDFARMIPLTLTGAGALHELPLPAEVYGWAERSDLGDLAVFNGAGETVPFTLIRPTVTTALSRRELPLFPLTGRKGRQQGNLAMQVRSDERGAIVTLNTTATAATAVPANVYIVDAATQELPVSGFDLGLTPAENGYVGTLQVETSDDLRQWRQHASGALATLATADRQLSRERVEFPPVKARYFRLTVSPEQGAPRLDAVTGRLESPGVAHGRQKNNYAIMPVKGRTGEYLVRTDGYLPVDRLRLVFPEENSLAGASFLSRPDDKAPWVERGCGTFYRLRRDATVVESVPLEIAPTTDRQWQIRVRHPSVAPGGSLPLLEIGWQPHRLVFAARGPAPFRLAYGSARLGPGTLRDAGIAAGLATWEKQQITPLPARAGASVESGGRQALRPRIAAATWRSAILWGALLLGMLLLAGMARRLVKEMGLDKAQKNQSKGAQSVVEQGRGEQQ